MALRRRAPGAALLPGGVRHRSSPRRRGGLTPVAVGVRGLWPEEVDSPKEPDEQGHLVLQPGHFTFLPIRCTGLLHPPPPEGPTPLLSASLPRTDAPSSSHGPALMLQQVLVSHTAPCASSPLGVILLTGRARSRRPYGPRAGHAGHHPQTWARFKATHRPWSLPHMDPGESTWARWGARDPQGLTAPWNARARDVSAPTRRAAAAARTA